MFHILDPPETLVYGKDYIHKYTPTTQADPNRVFTHIVQIPFWSMWVICDKDSGNGQTENHGCNWTGPPTMQQAQRLMSYHPGDLYLKLSICSERMWTMKWTLIFLLCTGGLSTGKYLLRIYWIQVHFRFDPLSLVKWSRQWTIFVGVIIVI